MKTHLSEVGSIYSNTNGTPVTEATAIKKVTLVGQPSASGAVTFHFTDDGTPSGTALFDNLTNPAICKCVGLVTEKNTSTITEIPLASIRSRGAKQIIVNVVESKTTNTLLISTAEGLEFDGANNSDTYVTITIEGS